MIDSDYHVAEGNRDKPARARQKRDGASDLAASHFDDAIDKANRRSHAQCHTQQHQADRGGGKRPRVAEYEANVTRRNGHGPG